MADTTPASDESSRLLQSERPAQGKGSAIATLKLMCESGAGLVADGYDLSVVNLALAILAQLYPESMTPSAKGLTVSITIIGVALGQLGFGSIADIVGRRLASLTTALLTISGAALSACVADTSGRFWNLSVQLCLCRFILGLGIGGEYPLSAAIAKEVKEGSLLCTRAQLLCVNMLLFNVGALLQSGLVSILLAARVRMDVVWRVAFAAGTVPSIAALLTRWFMHEPEQAKQSSSAEISSRHRYLHNLAETIGPRWPILLGACLSWCLFNFVAYGQGSFSAIICDRMLGEAESDTISRVSRDATFSLYCSLFAILGSVIGICIESLMSRQALQIAAFTLLAALQWLCAGLLHPLHDSAQWLLALLYFLTPAVASLLGITTYLVPSENFPAVSRATCVGLAAASGKAGAAIGTAMFPVAEDRLGLQFVLHACGFAMLLGALGTAVLTPATDASHEGEDAETTSKSE